MTAAGLPFRTLDVFTTKKFSGNPLAVVQLPEDEKSSHHASSDFHTIKQHIAREFNLSETVILHPPDEGDRTKRTADIFTPYEELPFAGHPTIGSLCFWATQDQSLSKGTLFMKAGPIPFTIDRPAGGQSNEPYMPIVANATVPHNVHKHSNYLKRDQMDHMQSALMNSIQDVPDEGWPLVSITKGMTFALIKVESMAQLSELKRSAYKPDLTLDEGWSPSFVGFYYYYLDSERDGHTRLETRMIEPEMGEDPVTGSAACALAAHLARETFQNSPRREAAYEITQGRHLGRQGTPKVRVTGHPDGTIEKIVLSGSAVKVMQGTIDVDISA